MLGLFSDLPFTSTPERIGELVFSNEFPSLTHFYSAMSGARTWFSGELYTVDLGRYADNPESRSRLLDYAYSNLDLSQIKRLFLVSNKDYGGIGGTVDPQEVNGNEYYFSITQCSYSMDGTTAQEKKLDEYGLVKLLIHEGGHSLGLPHANLAVCMENFGEGSDSCHVQEYGNLTPIMGWGSASLDAAQRTFLGFLEAPDTISVSEGVFNLKPLENGNGLRHISVPLGARSFSDPYCNTGEMNLSLEYRKRLGYDMAITDYSSGVREGVHLNAQITPCLRSGNTIFPQFERELLVDPSPGSVELAGGQTYAK